MPAELPAAQVIRFSMGGAYGGGQWGNVLHWKYAGGQITSTQLNTLCQSLGTAWNTHIAPICGTIVTLASVNAVDLTAPDAAVGGAPALAHAGDVVGPFFSANVAACATWKVNYRWRGGHPRTYFPAGTPASTTNSRTWTPTAITAFETAVNGYLGALNAMSTGAITGRLVCLRRWTTPVKGQPPQLLDPPLALDVVSFDVDSRIDTQRRRLGPDVSA